MTHKVSIIIPVYKVEKYLNTCVESAINQSYTNLQVILVDDGSPDSSPRICDEYAQIDKRIIVIHKANGGLSDARNRGLDSSIGDYVLFLDSDDYIEENTVEKLLKAIISSNADAAICNYRYVWPNNPEKGKKEAEQLPIKDEVVSAQIIMKEKMFELKPWYWSMVCGKLFKKSLFDHLRFETGRLYEDEFIFHQLYSQCSNIACVSDLLYNYIQRDESITGTNPDVKKLDSVEARLNRAAFYLEHNYEAAAFRTLIASPTALYEYFSKTHARFDKEHRVRYRSLQAQYRKIFRKVITRKTEVSHYETLKGIFCYINMYYSMRIVICVAEGLNGLKRCI